MTTTYYVVPAGAFFDSNWPDFPSLATAKQEIAERAQNGDDHDYGIHEVRLVAGSAKLPYARTMHIRGDRRIITSRTHAGGVGGYGAHDDGLGEDASPYGYGKTPEEAIAELLEALDHEQPALEEAR